MDVKLFNRSVHIPLNGLNVSRRMEYAILRRYLDLKGGERLLDVACGDGYWTSRLSQFARQVVGFDFNQDRLLQARKTDGVSSLVRSDAHNLPFRQDAFDAAIGICVLEHFRDDLQALQEVRRSLKNGGKLAMTVDSFSLPGITDEERARHAKTYSVAHWYRIENLQPLLEKAGFRVIRWQYMLGSPAAAAIYRATMKNTQLGYFFFPLAYPISLIGEALSKNNRYGYKLAVLAEAV